MYNRASIKFRPAAKLQPILFPILKMPQKTNYEHFGMYLDQEGKCRLVVAYYYMNYGTHYVEQWADFASEVLFACPYFEAAYRYKFLDDDPDAAVSVELFVFDLWPLQQIWPALVTGRYSLLPEKLKDLIQRSTGITEDLGLWSYIDDRLYPEKASLPDTDYVGTLQEGLGADRLVFTDRAEFTINFAEYDLVASKGNTLPYLQALYSSVAA